MYIKANLYKLFLGLSFILSGITLNAQNYEYVPMVKSGVQIWSDDFAYYTPVGILYYLNRYALTEEDTIIENETYKKLYLFSGSEFDSLTAQCIGGIRENEQKQVFFKGIGPAYTTQSGLICDFSLSVGDTFSVRDGMTFEEYGATFEVKDIDTIYLDGKRKMFTIRYYDFPSLIVAQWIEGIGNREGLLYNMFSKTLGLDFLGRNRCYEHNGILLYSDYPQGIDDCFTPALSLNDALFEDNSITLYPNPANKEVNISSQNIINSIEVFNSLGQKIYHSDIKANEKSIDINSLSKGVYIIGINTDKGYIRKKLIKD
ncbi:MAG: hypothetical protein H6Q16_1477 [Bacteroidetes bacterium]|nr:hypothetical protein [Bacteroidota bacterium]